jgi:hypothetical protein
VPRSAERRIEDALAALRRGLDELRVPWMIIGGIAVIARGVRRMTTDIDAVVLGDAAPVSDLVRGLALADIEPRIPDAEAFAKRNLVLLMRHAPTGVDLDISLAWSGFEREALAARGEVAYGRVRAPMASAEDLVVLKAVAGRPVDLDDVKSLLLLHKDIDVSRVCDRVRDLAELVDAPELLEALERAIAEARRAQHGRGTADTGRATRSKTPKKKKR